MPKEHNYQKEMEKHERKQRLRKTKKKMRPNTASRGPMMSGTPLVFTKTSGSCR